MTRNEQSALDIVNRHGLTEGARLRSAESFQLQAASYYRSAHAHRNSPTWFETFQSKAEFYSAMSRALMGAVDA